jgi:hypothetical protein
MRKYKAADIGDAAIYSFYKEEGGSIEKTRYTKFLKEFWDLVFDEIVQRNHWFRMPHGLGEIRIQENEVKSKIDEDGKLVHNMRMDFGATNKLWARDPKAKEEGKRIYHLNEHTDGMAYKIRWEKGHNKNGIWAYLFKPNRTFRKKLSAHLQDPQRKIQYFR